MKPRKQQPRKTKVLFVCIGNSCRSQMAEAWARHLASDVIESSSAGTAALGEVSRVTAQALAERGVAMDGQFSKPLRERDCAEAERIINITGAPGSTLFAAHAGKVEDWDVPDPYFGGLEMNRLICEDIERRVTDLAERLRNKMAKSKAQ